MRTTLLTLFLLPTLLFGSAIPHFNPATVHTFKGEIASIRTFNYATRPTPHKQLLLRTPKGEIGIDLGPLWYLDSQGILMAPGEQIEVEGSLVKTNGTHYVIASSITQGKNTYQLRDKNGVPLWRKH